MNAKCRQSGQSSACGPIRRVRLTIRRRPAQVVSAICASPPSGAERGALLEPPADLTDEAVDIDRQPPLARTRAGRLGALEALGQQPVELAHVPEGKRTKEGAKRRRRRQPAPQPPPRAPRAQQSAVVDRVGTEHRISAITLRPALPEPGRFERSRTSLCANASIPSRPARLATSITPASQTARSSSKPTCRASSPTGSPSCTMKVTS
jgi:hypothetical protein